MQPHTGAVRCVDRCLGVATTHRRSKVCGQVFGCCNHTQAQSGLWTGVWVLQPHTCPDVDPEDMRFSQLCQECHSCCTYTSDPQGREYHSCRTYIYSGPPMGVPQLSYIHYSGPPGTGVPQLSYIHYSGPPGLDQSGPTGLDITPDHSSGPPGMGVSQLL